MRGRQGLRLVGVLLCSGLLAALGACTDSPRPTPKSPSASPAAAHPLRLVVYGQAAVLEAYQRIVDDYNVEHPESEAVVSSYPTHAQAEKAVRTDAAAGTPPDVFLVDRNDLPALARRDLTAPVDQLLAERDVDFGEGFQRAGLEAFSSADSLQCMPTTVSPLVVYYNKRLIDLATLTDPGATPIDPLKGWNIQQFATAARQAATQPGAKGVYVAPDLDQVAPFVWSGGGNVVDDPEKPTTLDLASGSSQQALIKLLEIARDPQLTFDQAQLEKKSALSRFEDGTLGMILGYRDLTPQLRAHPGLDFDVMALPRVGRTATTNHMSGLCIAKSSKYQGAAADLIAYLVRDRSAGRLAQTGYVVPANTAVLDDDDFLQLGQRPVSGRVFQVAVRGGRLLPDTNVWPQVARQTNAALVRLFNDPVIEPLDVRLTAIDNASLSLLSPGSPTPSPSVSASVSP